ncbi:hypothetical protein CHS0354_036931 [Potamilus streckersoni]|uniref:Uncharacterized protein n=1 Tax=Potamilus streckersoni TaxID=2493646 RepID=A0AAE0SRA8_9BIVA|nr:hypothetical protein CHS0354_036931 [Potamilus streckersoni]
MSDLEKDMEDRSADEGQETPVYVEGATPECKAGVIEWGRRGSSAKTSASIRVEKEAEKVCCTWAATIKQKRRKTVASYVLAARSDPTTNPSR